MNPLSPDDESPSAELAPRRLLDGGASHHEQSLVASARLDRVPGAARARVAAALGGVLERQAAPSTAPDGGRAQTEPGDALPRGLSRSSLALVGAGIVGAIALSLWLRGSWTERASLVTTPRAAADATGERSAARAAIPERRPEAELGQRPAAPAQPASEQAPGDAQRAHLARQLDTAAQPAKARREAPPQRERSDQRRARAAGATRDDGVDSGLLAEVRALEAVSRGIAARDAERAARELSTYRRRFPRGELATEADLLAVEIAAARGDARSARARAERLLARPEAEHYHARVRSLLQSTAQRGEAQAANTAQRGSAQPASTVQRTTGQHTDALPATPTTPESGEERRSNGDAAHMRARR